MINLDDELRRASARSPWPVRDALQMLHGLADRLQIAYDWDEEAGEAWGSLFDEERAWAKIHMKLPLVVARRGIEDPVQSLMTSAGISNAVTIYCDHMDKVAFQASRSVLDLAFPGTFPLAGFNEDGFSISELCWATI